MCSKVLQHKVINTYFQQDSKNNQLYANSVLLDMEPKVVQQCLNSRPLGKEGFQWAYHPQLAYFKQGGSGNNWALGYRYLGSEEYNEVNNRLRTVLERTDYF